MLHRRIKRFHDDFLSVATGSSYSVRAAPSADPMLESVVAVLAHHRLLLSVQCRQELDSFIASLNARIGAVTEQDELHTQLFDGSLQIVDVAHVECYVDELDRFDAPFADVDCKIERIDPFSVKNQMKSLISEVFTMEKWGFYFLRFFYKNRGINDYFY